MIYRHKGSHEPRGSNMINQVMKIRIGCKIITAVAVQRHAEYWSCMIKLRIRHGAASQQNAIPKEAVLKGVPYYSTIAVSDESNSPGSKQSVDPG